MIHSVLRRGTLHDPLIPKGGTLLDALSPEDRDVARIVLAAQRICVFRAEDCF